MTTKANPSAKRSTAGLITALVILLLAAMAAATTLWWRKQPPPYGLQTRTAWTASKVLGTPEPPDEYLTERVFPDLTFVRPLDIAFAPGSNRVFVAQIDGKIVSFPNDNSVKKADLMLDMTKVPGREKIPGAEGITTYGLTFHPQFQKNHYCYVCYQISFPYRRAVDYAAAWPANKTGQRVSRFTVSDTDPPTVDPKTEQIIIATPGGGHMGSCMKFGPDGNLYISTGDNGDPNPPDPFNIGQNVGDLRSKILRIDVDHPTDDKPYSIPSDNPFVTLAGARGEVFSYGFRNPWRFSFDRNNGAIWVGDVGWELWEMVYRADKGGNYGWSIMEGPQAVHPKGKRGPTPIIPPQAALPHTEAASITGGFVYHGNRVPALQNKYIFGDWETRQIWAAPVDEKNNLGKYRTIAHTDLRIVSFGEDDKGEVYIVDYEGGGLWRISPNPSAGKESAFPRKLSDTGLFADITRQEPNPGVVPYTVKAPQWVDGSTSQRFIAVPGNDPIYDHEDGKRYPKNIVFARTLSLPMVAGDAASARKIETQLLQYDGRQWHGYSYQWNPEQTDAILVGNDGHDEPLTVIDPAAPGGKRQQTWHFNSRAQCMTCHTTWTKYAIGFTDLQLDHNERYDTPSHGLVSDNQLRSLRHIGLVPAPPAPRQLKIGEKPPKEEPVFTLVDPYDSDPKTSLDERARSYLSVNCSICHRFGGGGTALIDLTREKSLADTKLLTNPMLGTFNLRDAQVVCPGEPGRSVLYYRMAKTGSGHMPHLGATVIDDRGLALIGQWITSLQQSTGSAPITQTTQLAIADQTAALQSLQSGAAAAPATSAIDALLSSTDGALRLVSAMDDGRVPRNLHPVIAERALASPDDTIRGLYVRFSTKPVVVVEKVGASPNIEKLLALAGDGERGRKVFFETAGGLCSKCHIVDGKGLDFGPDLSHIGTKYTKADLLDNIVHPSKTILPGYETHVVRLKSGDVRMGFQISESGSEVVLKDPERKLVNIPTADIDKNAIQPISAMPEGMLVDLTPQQAADLLEFLAGRK